MRYIKLILTFSLFSSFVQAQNFQFDRTNYDFGTVTQGEEVQVTFNFLNTTQKDLIIGQVHTSCGCTVTEWSENIIRPQEYGFLTVRFDTKKHPGSQTKVLIMVYNYLDGNPVRSREQKLTLKGYVSRN